MRILMLSWEYPPANVGGLARHVHHLSRELARRGNLVEVVTQGAREAAGTEEVSLGEGLLRVHRRSAYTLSSPDFLHWVHQLNYSFLETVMGLEVRRDELDGPFELVHAHDWLVAFTARAVKHAYRLPLVATIHATEAGRHHGIHNPWQRYISEVEWWLTYEAWRVICCSGYMESELAGQFQLPGDKIRVIPNGVDPTEVEAAVREAEGGGEGEGAPRGVPSLRRHDFAQPGEDIVFFVGRLVREKGVDTLLDAFPAVLDRRPATRLVIGGTGPHESHLRGRVAAMGFGDAVRFTGYLDDRTRDLLYHWASVAVVPSYYEPFGLTALEAMAAGCPVVVSDTGGLAETVAHNITGLKVPPANPGELASAILSLLCDPPLAARLGAGARSTVTERFSWSAVALETAAVYEEVIREAQASGWTGGGGDEESSGKGPLAPGEDWEAMRRRTRVMTRGLEPIGRYNPPS
ncbi:MAG: glycosyltransferase family 4 protein [Bacillota bacterium]|jgi:glycogen(starch) synthase